MIRNHEMVLEALLSAGKEHAPNIPEELLRKAYEIQGNHQFEKDQEIRLREMARLVEEYVGQVHDHRRQV